MSLGELDLQRPIGLCDLTVFPQSIPKEQSADPPLTPQHYTVYVVSAGPRDGLSKVAPVGNRDLVLGDVLVAQIAKPLDPGLGVDEGGEPNRNVDHGFGHEAGDGRAPDVFDSGSQPVENLSEKETFSLEPGRPHGVVRDDLDPLYGCHTHSPAQLLCMVFPNRMVSLGIGHDGSGERARQGSGLPGSQVRQDHDTDLVRGNPEDEGVETG